jgi:hypothetical protein
MAYRLPEQVIIDTCNNCKLEICDEADSRCQLIGITRLESRVKPTKEILKQDIISILTKLVSERHKEQRRPAQDQVACT